MFINNVTIGLLQFIQMYCEHIEDRVKNKLVRKHVNIFSILFLHKIRLMHFLVLITIFF